MLRRALPAGVAIAAIAFGAFLRFDSLGEPSFWLDEILGYDLTTAAKSHAWWSWVAGFEREHGPLFYASQLLGRVGPAPETAGRLMPALFGIATLIMIWVVANRHDQVFTALATLAVLATSPLHVYYSREARPYGLVMFTAAALLWAILSRPPVWVVAGVLAVAAYSSATAWPLVVAVASTAVVSGALERDRIARRRDWISAALSVCACALMLLIYGGGSRAATGSAFAIDLSFLTDLVRAFGVTAIDADSGTRTAFFILLLALAGAVDLIARDRRTGFAIVAMAVLPVALAITALLTVHHWYAVRYVCAGLPAYALLVGAGIAVATRPFGMLRWPVMVFIVSLIAAQTIPAARREPFQKLDWRLVAETLWSHAQQDDRVITAEAWSTVCLRHYLGRLPPRLRLAEVAHPAIGDMVVAESQPVWIVAAGYIGDHPMRHWACRYPIVLASRLENLRVHYAPGAEHFLAHRSTPIDGPRMLRMTEPGDHYLDERTAWRGTVTRFSPTDWNREAVARLLARLGFDPPTALRRLANGSVHLEDLVESVAPASVCKDDTTFVRELYGLLLQRKPSAGEERELLSFMASGTSRLRLVGKVMKKEEFRQTLALHHRDTEDTEKTSDP